MHVKYRNKETQEPVSKVAVYFFVDSALLAKAAFMKISDEALSTQEQYSDIADRLRKSDVEDSLRSNLQTYGDAWAGGNVLDYAIGLYSREDEDEVQMLAESLVRNLFPEFHKPEV